MYKNPLSSFDRYLEFVEYKKQQISKYHEEKNVLQYVEKTEELKKQIQENEEFPFFVILECSYTEHSVLERVCWETIGEPQFKNCGGQDCCGNHLEYPSCPLILATRYVYKNWHTNKEGLGGEYLCSAYRDVPEHSHNGNWKNLWLEKTGYDFGIGAILFKKESDKELFLEALSKHSLQDFYKKEEEIEKNTPLAKIFPSKWGWHEVSYVTFWKLKSINASYSKSLHLAAAHRRMNAKLPENRNEIFEKPNPLFFTDLKDNGLGERIRVFTRKIKTPKKDPEDVDLNLDFTEDQIEEIFKKLK